MIEIRSTSTDDCIRWVTLRPHVSTPERVTLDGEGIAALEHELVHAHDDQLCRALVLSGEDGAYCDGLDLEAALGASAEVRRQDLLRYANCLRLLREMDALTVAMVDGRAAGGGAGLALACDVVLATRKTSFSFPEVLWGLLPGVIYPVMVERIGVASARMLALTGGTVHFDDPMGMSDSLWQRCVDYPCDDTVGLDRAAHAVLKQALRSSPAAIAAMKRYAAGEGPERMGRPAESATPAPVGEYQSVASRSAFAQRLADGVGWTDALLGDAANREQLRGLLEGELPAWNRRYRHSSTQARPR